MRVRSSARPPGGGKEIEVVLYESDMGDIAGFDSFPPAQRWRQMTDRADLLIVEYLLRRGDISSEFAAARVREIREGRPSS